LYYAAGTATTTSTNKSGPTAPTQKAAKVEKVEKHVDPTPAAPKAPAKDLSKVPRTSLTFASNGMHLERTIVELFRASFLKAFPTLAANPPKVVMAPSKPNDYQVNNAMALAKQLSKTTKEITDAIIANLPPNDVFEDVTADTKGFVYMNISSQYLADSVKFMSKSGVKHIQTKQRVLVDFSSPNIAKDMHVGHLRSTIIGDCLCRIYEFCGHEVHRVNHVGDWGTQFGMLIAYLKKMYPNCLKEAPPIADLAAFYKKSKVEFDSDPAFKAEAYKEVVALQSGDKNAVAAWTLLCNVSRAEFEVVYKRLGVTAKEFGESFYRDKIPGVLDLVAKAGMVTTLADGAKVIMPVDDKPLASVDAKELGRTFLYAFKDFKTDKEILDVLTKKGLINAEGVLAFNKKESKKVADIEWQVDGEKVLKACESLLGSGAKIAPEILAIFKSRGVIGSDDVTHVPKFAYPLIVVKRDGGFTYDTTDLAAVYYRTQVLKADKVVVITDVGQAGHFDLINTTADKIGWTKGHVVEHVGFGLVTGIDGKRFRTRSSDTVRLVDLMDEAVTRCYDIAAEREKEHPQGFTEDVMKRNAEILGIAAIKYSDLKQNRTSDYAFSFDKMCELQGNTALYLLYSYVRICGVFRKAAAEAPVAETDDFEFTDITARNLALHLCRFQASLDRTMDESMPSRLTDFAYNTVCRFTDFYGARNVQIPTKPNLILFRTLPCRWV
jgi:arginyl-tRNA synthetase